MELFMCNLHKEIPEPIPGPHRADSRNSMQQKKIKFNLNFENSLSNQEHILNISEAS